MNIKRGDIYYADLSPVVGSEQGGVRPVLIVQNDVGNKFSPTVIAAAITSQQGKTSLPTHIEVNAHDCGLAKDSVVLLEQVRTIMTKRRLKEKMGTIAYKRYDQNKQRNNNINGIIIIKDRYSYGYLLFYYFDKRITFHENGLSSAVRIEPSTVGSGLI